MSSEERRVTEKPHRGGWKLETGDVKLEIVGWDKELDHISHENFETVVNQMETESKLINGLIKSLKKKL